MTLRSNKREPFNWFSTELGNSFQAIVGAELFRIFPKTYYSVVLDLGPGTAKYLQNLDAGLVLRVNPTVQKESWHTVVGTWEDLPLGRNSIDLIVLQHTLDFAGDPMQVLRQTVEALRPEGRIVICGFNPLGLWGMSRLLFQSTGRVPWSAHFLSPTRVQDWLTLLGAEITEGSYFYYRPPVNSLPVLKKLDSLERIGARWWPTLSGAYLIVGKKRQLSSRYIAQKSPVSRRRMARALHTMKTFATVDSGKR